MNPLDDINPRQTTHLGDLCDLHAWQILPGRFTITSYRHYRRDHSLIEVSIPLGYANRYATYLVWVRQITFNDRDNLIREIRDYGYYKPTANVRVRT